MLENFSVAGTEQLNTLKEELFIHPGNYFFKPREDFASFKNTCKEMGSLQLEFLNASLNATIELLNIFTQIGHGILRLSFSNVGALSSRANKEVLAAIENLSLGLGLLFLQSIRISTLSMVTFLPKSVLRLLAVAAIVFLYSIFPLAVALGGFVSTCIGSVIVTRGLERAIDKRLVKIKQKNLDSEELDNMIDEVGKERAEIVEKMAKINIASRDEPVESSDRYKLFPYKINLSSQSYKISQQEALNERYDNRELVRELNVQINSYPDFEGEKAKMPGYTKQVIRDVLKHHEGVMALAAECYRRAEMAHASQKIYQEELKILKGATYHV